MISKGSFKRVDQFAVEIHMRGILAKHPENKRHAIIKVRLYCSAALTMRGLNHARPWFVDTMVVPG